MIRNAFAVAAAVALMLGVDAGSASAAKCIKAGGWGTGLTEGVAKFMAEAALKNQAKGWGGDNVKIGPVAQSCKFELGFQCNATAKACK